MWRIKHLPEQILHQLLHAADAHNFNIEFSGIRFLVEFGDVYFFKTQFIGFGNALVHTAYGAHLAAKAHFCGKSSFGWNRNIVV